MFTAVRRSVMVLVSMAASVWATHYYEWHKDQFSFKNSLESLLWLVLVLVAIGAGFWVFLGNHNRSKTAVAVVLTAAVVLWGNSVLDGIKPKDLAIIAGVVVAVFVLVTLTVIDRPMINGFRREFIRDRRLFGQSRSSSRTPFTRVS